MQSAKSVLFFLVFSLPGSVLALDQNAVTTPIE